MGSYSVAVMGPVKSLAGTLCFEIHVSTSVYIFGCGKVCFLGITLSFNLKTERVKTEMAFGGCSKPFPNTLGIAVCPFLGERSRAALAYVAAQQDPHPGTGESLLLVTSQ